MIEKVWYRIEDRLYSTCSIDAAGCEQYGTSVGIVTSKFMVLKHTPKGVWLDIIGGRRWVSRESHKRFACPTLEEARESFRARKARQIRILRKQISNIEHALQLVEVKN